MAESTETKKKAKTIKDTSTPNGTPNPEPPRVAPMLSAQELMGLREQLNGAITEKQKDIKYLEGQLFMVDQLLGFLIPPQNEEQPVTE